MSQVTGVRARLRELLEALINDQYVEATKALSSVLVTKAAVQAGFVTEDAESLALFAPKGKAFVEGLGRAANGWTILLHPDPDKGAYPPAQVDKLVKHLSRHGTVKVLRSTARNLELTLFLKDAVYENDVWNMISRANLDDDLEWGGSVRPRRAVTEDAESLALFAHDHWDLTPVKKGEVLALEDGDFVTFIRVVNHEKILVRREDGEEVVISADDAAGKIAPKGTKGHQLT